MKKSKKRLFNVAFVFCVLSFLTMVVGFLYAMAVPDMDSGDRHTLVAIIGGVVTICLFVYLTIAVGERDEDGIIPLSLFDKLFTEIQLLVLGLLVFFGGLFFAEQVYRLIVDGWPFPSVSFPFTMAFILVFGVGVTTLSLALLLSCIKKLKAGKFFAQSLCGWIIHKAYEIYLGGSTMKKVVLAAVLFCVLSATMFLAPVVLVMVLVFAPKWVKKYDEIKNGIKEVNEGNLAYKIPEDGGQGELDQLARGINQISEATSIAVENELKNQKLKTDLISNVSHDLKTPLTSMITYLDLLKTEGLDHERAPEYLEILEKKTNRLRTLTEDLFEAAKASSGAIPVRMGVVDLQSLLNQGMAEIEQRVEEQQLDFIIAALDEHFYVHADGQLLWRVVENLLGNAVKYSQEGTRVYLDMRSTPEHTVLEVKNISKHSLNIDPATLTDRFKRGDESRSTEGSGLGLAIAKDLMKLMGGAIEIKIDGDLFKAIVTLQSAEVPMREQDPEEMQAVEEIQEEKIVEAVIG